MVQKAPNSKALNMSAEQLKDRASSYNSNYNSSVNMTPCISVMKQFRD
jgi:hypothetical protein